MSRIMITSDLHLSHRNITKFRTRFSSVEEHDEFVVQSLIDSIHKRDVLYLLGDICFTKQSLSMIQRVNCAKKILILGNHDTERLHITDLVGTFDDVHSLFKYKHAWLSHCPMHPDELRNKINIHGHTHTHIIGDNRYINACVDVNDFKPICFQDVIKNRTLI